MKKSDIASLIFISSLSVIMAYFIAQTVIGGPASQGETVKTMDAISADVVKPDPDIFNAKAINPTVEIIIGDSGNVTTTVDNDQNQ